MKICTERAPLAEALTWVTRVIGKTPQAAALGGVRFSAIDGVLTIRAFDYDSAHTAAIVADVVTEGECLVPGFFLRDAVSGGRGTDVEMVLDGVELTITSGRSTYRCRVLKLDEYPDLPAFPTKVGEIHADSLAEALAGVIGGVDDASPNDKVRGLRVEGVGDVLHLVGTDGYRFHAVEASWTPNADFAATTPGRSFAVAAKGMTERVEIGFHDGLLGLSDGSRQVTMRCFGSDYAPWRDVIASARKRITTSLTVDGDDLLAAVKQVGAVVGADLRVVMTHADNELTVDTGFQEGGEGAEVLPTTGDGTALRVAVNPRYLGDLLAACSGGPVALEYGAGKNRSEPLMVSDPARPHLTLMLMTKEVR